ncbi:MAG: hypothetical protein DU430_08140 [Candidatus Tokpelaia sp.]|nr:MAG: hypothetical protein DU430_08140 [Candidatus Tokpelaia sp.]
MIVIKTGLAVISDMAKSCRCRFLYFLESGASFTAALAADTGKNISTGADARIQAVIWLFKPHFS